MPGATLPAQAGAAATARGGRLEIDVASLADADALLRLAGAGGATRSFALRQRSGDLALSGQLQAEDIRIAADAGSLALAGATLDARAPGGGVVQLAAAGDLRLDGTSRILAGSSRAGAQGGDVLLASGSNNRSGLVALAADAVVDAQGDSAADGRIVLRAARGADNASVAVDALNTANLRAGEVDIEAVRRYSTVTVGSETRAIATIAAGNSLISGVGAARAATLGQTTLRNDSAAFMAAAAAINRALGLTAADSGRVQLRAGVEVQAAGNLNVAADWALNADRPGGDAGFLTLRAAGNLSVNGSISDGFASAATTAALNDNARSWSLRLAAGADLAAAHPLATRDFSAGAAETGNLNIAAGRLLRTGAGSITLAAGRDIVFGAGNANTAPGLAYVAGRKTADLAPVLTSLFAPQAAKPAFTEQGGRLELRAARDISAFESTQLVNNWLWRSGLQSTRAGEEGLYANGAQLAWWAEFSRFRQTLGSFGGGALSASAGRDVRNLQAMLPSAGWADSRVMATAGLHTLGGADLEVRAGRDLLGGQFLVAAGAGRIDAGRSIVAAGGNLGIADPVLAQMDGGRWQLQARNGLQLVGSFNPTAAPASAADNRANVSGFFYGWGDDAALVLRANAGTLSLTGGLSASQTTRYGLQGGVETPDYFRVLPATLRAQALGGDLQLLGAETAGALLFPSARGQLDLWAAGALRLGGSGNTPNFAMADSDPALWPDASRPAGRTASLLAGLTGLVSNTLADTQPRQALHSGDSEPARLHAGGSISMSGDATLLLAKPARLDAGDDIVNLRLVGQNLAAGDTTTVTAGRNLLAGLQGLIAIGGPGALEVNAGRGIDLGASGGIVTSGNQRNARLPTQGADIRVAAATRGVLDLAQFAATYLDGVDGANGLDGNTTPRYRDALTRFMRAALASPTLDYDSAWAQFQALPAAEQARFGEQVLAAEFGRLYLAATPPDAAQMSAALRSGFERRKAQVLEAGTKALAGGGALVLPGRESLAGAALADYLAELRGLDFGRLDIDSTLQARVASRAAVYDGWRDAVAARLGGSAAALEAMAAADPAAPAALAWRGALAQRSGAFFEAYRQQVLETETASAAAAASLFGRRSLPLRLALFDQGFAVATLALAGSFTPQPVWPGQTPVIAYSGTLEMTQSAVLSERGGDIRIVNPGGGISVGLKESGANAGPKGVIALGGGQVYGFARDDFQVNTQRVFIVGEGNMNIWSSRGDIDSGRGANTAVAAPPLAARRSADGVVFEVPATTTGSGLGILEDARGRRLGTIGLYPAFGEILALDAFIRAPSVVLGSTIKGADNLQAAAVGGAVAAVGAPALAVAAPPATAQKTEGEGAASGATQTAQARQRQSLLTVELLGVGEEACSDKDEREGKCNRPADGACTPQQKADGRCS
ncbi:hypothetical protein RA210_U150001 [Rubrivivax sp. A210]|nr:hypothetical protein RA210_U150001 [Rubrivivax sp. A210]